jgi:hypothetical protein
MTDRELMQMAIDALEQPSPIGGFDNQAYVAKTLRDRLAQPEPVHASDISQERVDETAKRKQEWVGLTDEEIYQIGLDTPIGATNFARAIEAKLKEKNT